MIKDLKALLSTVTVNIIRDVNSTHISFSFLDEGTIKENEIIKEIDKSLKKDEKKNVEKAVDKIKDIVKQSGIPKDKVIIGSIKPLTDMFPEVPKRSKLMLDRIAELEALGFKETDKEMANGAFGLALTYIEKTEEAEFRRAVGQIVEMKTKAEATRSVNKSKDDSIVHQIEAKSVSKNTASATLTLSPEQQEIIEEQFAVPTDVTYKGKPATLAEAFDVPEPPSVPEPPIAPKAPAPNMDMHFIASNPMEQMKKNMGKAYLNKAGVLIEPIVVKSREDLWTELEIKCQSYGIDFDMELDDNSVEDILNLHKYIDETILEEKLILKK